MASAPELHAGMRLGGLAGSRYELIEKVGSGFSGTVWRARDHDLDAIVAVKLLDPEIEPDRVLQEAQLHQRLSEHPRIVSIRNVELGANPSSFVVGDLIVGGSVQAVLDVRRPTVRETVRWLIDVLEALDHAHEESVFHRDVKPSNLLLGPDGHAMLTDFGIAEDSLKAALPALGMYQLLMPPEFQTTPTTAQTDLWLVGALGWQLLVGERPAMTDTHQGTLLLAHRYSQEVPIALSKAIMSALAPDPAERPESAQRLLETINAIRVFCGWHDLPPTAPHGVRAWRADEAGGQVIVEIGRRPREGDFLVQARAPAGSRLTARRHAVEPTEAKALLRARSWLTTAIAGKRL